VGKVAADIMVLVWLATQVETMIVPFFRIGHKSLSRIQNDSRVVGHPSNAHLQRMES
jgi:hypothetical protein